MSLVIYIGWHIFQIDSDGLLASEKAPLTLNKIESVSLELNNEASLFIENMNGVNETLNQWLAQDTKRQLTLIWPQPSAYISAGLALGQDPEPLVKQWQEDAQAVLTIFRHHRRQVKLLGAAPGEQLVGANAADFESLNSEWQKVQTLTISPIYRLAATQLVDNDIFLKDSLNYLQASSQACTLTTESAITTVSDAVRSYRSAEVALLEIEDFKKQNENLQNQNDSFQKENELLIAQMHHVQEELEEIYFGDQVNGSKNVAFGKAAFDERERSHQQTIHQLQSITTWLRAYAYRQTTVAYRDSRAYRKAVSQQVAMIEASDYFDSNWYRSEYTDVAGSRMNPAEHYVKFGVVEGRNPSPRFNTDFYLVKYTDVATSGLNPLLHYLRYGINEQRETVAEVAL